MSETLSESLYPFVKVSSPNDKNYQTLREQEILLNSRIRYAVSNCKNSVGIKTNNLANISSEEKSSIETCLQKNYLDNDSSYFGKRDSIFIDLNSYN